MNHSFLYSPLFDRLVDEALNKQREFNPLRAVVENELLHNDILREMSEAGLLSDLTFIGGTCLRACYGSNRLSEDLDFTGGASFKRETLTDLGRVLVDRLKVKYSLQVEVGEPVRDTGNTDTWKLKVVTHPRQNSQPVQRIHIDIYAIPSYDKRPMLLRNHYGVEMGTSGLIIQAQSREEIFADKMVAFALRPNRIKNRDLWDIGWLKQQNIILPLKLIPKKVKDHRRTAEEFLHLLEKRVQQVSGEPKIRNGFIQEMRRFLPPQVISRTVENEEFWIYLINLVRSESARILHALRGTQKENDGFAM
jgi:predicted nucleotidyltransferase component of viral defense system